MESEEGLCKVKHGNNRQHIHKAKQIMANALLSFRTLMNVNPMVVEAELTQMETLMTGKSDPINLSTLASSSVRVTDMQEVHNAAIMAYTKLKVTHANSSQTSASYTPQVCQLMRGNLCQWFNLDVGVQQIIAAQVTPTQLLCTEDGAEQQRLSDLNEKRKRTNVADEPNWCSTCGNLLMLCDAMGGNVCENCGEWFPFYTHNANAIAFREAQPQQAVRTEVTNSHFPQFVQRMQYRGIRQRAAPKTKNATQAAQQTSTQKLPSCGVIFPDEIIRVCKAKIEEIGKEPHELTYAQFSAVMKDSRSTVPIISKYYRFGQFLYTHVTGRVIPTLSDVVVSDIYNVRDELEPRARQIWQERGQARSNCMNCPYTLSVTSAYLGLHDFEAHVPKMSLQNRAKNDPVMQEAKERMEKAICEAVENPVLISS